MSVLISSIKPHSPASRHFVRAGSKLISVNGHEIRDVLDYQFYIDEDIQAWRSYMPVYPEEWYNGFDPDFVLRENDIYAVRAIPSLYLLDAEKRVILKDAPENKVFNVIASR